MRMDRADALVAFCFALTAVATIGISFDLWQLVYYPIPLLVTLFMMMGALDEKDTWSRAAITWILVFGLVLTLLFAAADAMLRGEVLIGGLPASTAIFLYALWPFSTVAGPLLYALVYRIWIRHGLDTTENP